MFAAGRRLIIGIPNPLGVMCGLGALTLGLGGYGFTGARVPRRVDYNRDVQPLLHAKCGACHSPASKSGGLDLTSVASMLAGGTSGAAVIPFRGAQSLIVQRLSGLGGKPSMPLGFASIDPKDIQTVRDWIDAGCPGPKGAPSIHWAYVAPVKPNVPRVKEASWVKNPIDAFVLAKLEHERLHHSPAADRTTLIRRLSLDLIGLPPTPDEVDAFNADRSKDAVEKVVDRLLASPHFGERMALPWLDAARYADSNGFQQDGDNFQYVWRDWVVRALNANMPYDRFTVDQIAGDLLPDSDPSTPKGMDQIVATAFNRNHMLNGEGGAIPEEQRNVYLFDRVDTTSTTWLGITMACSRCHDHKYDPFTQKDYYSLLAFFNNVPETGGVSGGPQYYIADPWIYAGSDQQMSKMRVLELELQRAKEDKQVKKQLDDLRAQIPRVMVMSDRQRRETYIYSRGSYLSPIDKVTCNTPASLPSMPATEPRNRLGLADWLVSPKNPLTARVEVNRIWQTLFGRGLVRTPEDFGVKGEPPTHPELLDWLAVDFREHGWNLKRLVKQIVMSATYQQSSKCSKDLRLRDPENRLLARGARFRLQSMLIRDEALASSGLLNPDVGGKPVYPYQPAGIWDGLAITDERDFTYPQSHGKDLYRRSIYSFWRRTAAPGDIFDAASRQVCTVRQFQTSTPLHALTTLNDVTWIEAGRALAERVMLSEANPNKRLSEAFRRVCARRPDAQELNVLNRSLQHALVYFAEHPDQAKQYLSQGESKRSEALDPVQHAAYATVCLAIFNLDEALTRE